MRSDSLREGCEGAEFRYSWLFLISIHLYSLSFCVQVCLFSATMAPEILDMTSKFMRNAVRILVKKDGHCHFASLCITFPLCVDMRGLVVANICQHFDDPS